MKFFQEHIETHRNWIWRWRLKGKRYWMNKCFSIKANLSSVYEFNQQEIESKKKVYWEFLCWKHIQKDLIWNVIVSLESHKAMKFHFIDMNRKPYWKYLSCIISPHIHMQTTSPNVLFTHYWLIKVSSSATPSITRLWWCLKNKL